MSNQFKKNSSKNLSLSLSEKEIKLSANEAESLAHNLKEQIKKGLIPDSSTEFIDLLIEGLGDQRGLLRRTFSQTLYKIGRQATPALINALDNHSKVIVRRAAAKTLRLIKDPRSLPHLLKALTTDEDPVVQGSSAAAMAVFGEEAVEMLLQVFNNDESTSMQCGLASWGIAFIGAKAPKAIIKAASSPNPKTRAAAIGALGDQIYKCGDQVARNIVLKALNDPSEDVRSEATILIGKLNEKNWGEPFLINKLNDSSQEVTKNAALALMKIKAVESIPNLKKKQSEEKDIKLLKVLNLAIERLEMDLKEQI